MIGERVIDTGTSKAESEAHSRSGWESKRTAASCDATAAAVFSSASTSAACRARGARFQTNKTQKQTRIVQSVVVISRQTLLC